MFPSVLLYPGLLDFCPFGFLSSGGSVGVYALLVRNLWAVVRSGSTRNLSVLTRTVNLKLSCGLNRSNLFGVDGQAQLWHGLSKLLSSPRKLLTEKISADGSFRLVE